MKTSHEIDFCHGPLFKQMLVFSFPLLLSCILQLSFQAADLVVIGRFASAESLGAVGATEALCNLLLTIAFGLAVGVNIIVAQAVGAKDKKRISNAVHTSLLVSLISGFFLLFLSLATSRWLLRLMLVPEEVFKRSCLYMLGFSFSIPPMVFYNFGSAIMRSVGDTRRPLYYLTISGVVNVILNLVFVISFKMDVSGVAWATAISQLLSAVLITRALYHEKSAIRFIPSELRIDPGDLKQLLRTGLPAGVQCGCFSISNMIIQGAVNSLGTLALAGNTAASMLESYIYIIAYSTSQAAVSIVGQNYGGNKPKRILTSVKQCNIAASVAMAVTGVLMLVFGRPCLRAFTDVPEAIQWGMDRLYIVLPTYFLCATMDNYSGALRGLGNSIVPAAISFVFVIVMRILWVFLVFPIWPNLLCLMISYPISWLLATIGNGIAFHRFFRSIFFKNGRPYLSLRKA